VPATTVSPEIPQEIGSWLQYVSPLERRSMGDQLPSALNVEINAPQEGFWK
jgi:hypothetical protein